MIAYNCVIGNERLVPELVATLWFRKQFPDPADMRKEEEAEKKCPLILRRVIEIYLKGLYLYILGLGMTEKPRE